MTFWIIAGLMAALVALLLVLTVLRARASVGPAAAFDLQVYRDQLKEVDRDLARGVIGQSDAERIRTEVSRRILAADAQMQDGQTSTEAPGAATYAMAVVIFAALVGGTLYLYRDLGALGYGDLALDTRIEMARIARETRPDQATAEASLPAGNPQPELSADYTRLIEQLRTTVAQRPDDLQGHMLLARNEAAIGNYVAAYTAQREVLRIKGDEASASDYTDLGDMLILAAGGYVSPEAEAALARALQLDPNNGPARYYQGLMLAQTGRPDQAFRIWDNLLRAGPANAPWIEPIRLQIEQMADLAGVNYALPVAAAVASGPSAADVAAASEMSVEDRQEMIRGMVNGLSDRLATEGGPPFDWARLIAALGVLGEEERAIAVYTEALSIFDGDPEAIELIRNGARQAQLIP
ncbi:c-type cytochrome biogenesis protein CcmI [Sulfitobacter sp. JL08]|uniref:c-type cytochrome biogenesis protein CcmI n=1 Tax=Sulfitobacter sp. JL08 TaxID=2070369 RepID=UPI000E0A70A1|nr:c-type cytochrome biogenesis protein CcmI [Sulfitobacter sp. JL08]AXI56887.1 c-type cytochrome biogenesis protein CcmI [Sulfitobacter sp. JL08]